MACANDGGIYSNWNFDSFCREFPLSSDSLSAFLIYNAKSLGKMEEARGKNRRLSVWIHFFYSLLYFCCTFRHSGKHLQRFFKIKRFSQMGEN